MAEMVPQAMDMIKHYPVMFRELAEFLDVSRRRMVVDCTVGMGSLAAKFLELMPPEAFLVGMDRDQDSLDIASRNLRQFASRFSLVKSDFLDLDKALNGLGIGGADAFVFDLGISTYQLLTQERGFSFLREGNLDMRMDRDSFVSAYDLVNNLSEVELVSIFRKFGEERFAGRIARHMVEARRKDPVATTTQLADIILRAVPGSSRKYKIHPATRVFQALRIAVNRELEVLRPALEKAVSRLNPGGSIAVISFHSLEDRIVKRAFRDFAAAGMIEIVTRKPVVPGEEEMRENSASRSAKLRVVRKA